MEKEKTCFWCDNEVTGSGKLCGSCLALRAAWRKWLDDHGYAKDQEGYHDSSHIEAILPGRRVVIECLGSPTVDVSVYQKPYGVDMFIFGTVKEARYLTRDCLIKDGSLSRVISRDQKTKMLQRVLSGISSKNQRKI